MAVYSGKSSDKTLNGYISSIRTAEYGVDARAPMAASIQRCYELAKIKAGATLISQSVITAQTNRIKTEKYGDNVRDAFRIGIELCYQSRGIDITSVEMNHINSMIYAQTGEDLKNSILRCIVKCCQDVS